MNKVLIVLLSAFVAFCLAVGGLFGYAISVRNSLIRQENGIKAQDLDMQNVHASIYQQMESQGLVAKQYGKMVIDALDAAISGRYGEGGAKAAMLWIQEQNPNIDPSIMAKLQVTIEAGYNKFESAQRTKIDNVRTYANQLDVFPSNIVASMFGFPRIDMALANRIVTSGTTKQDFSTGELSQPKLFNE